MRVSEIFKMLAGKKYYLLMDGMHSCVYVPKHTYRYLYRLMLKSLDKNSKAENSLRFLWSREQTGKYLLTVNPATVEMTRTHGLALDNKKRMIIPCPYIQQIYQSYGLPPEYCGRIYLGKIDINLTGEPWLSMFELKRA